MNPRSENRPMFRLSIDAKILYDHLITAKTGDVFLYEDLSKLIGRDVRSPAAGHSALYSARNRAQRDNQVVFGVVRGQGIKRLSDQEIIQSGEYFVRAIRHTSTRGVKRVTAVQDFDSLPEAVKVKHNTYASVFGAIGASLHAARVKRIESRVATLRAKLPLNETIRAFLD